VGSKAPWMPFYGADFFGDGLVRRMRRETRCLYLELLWHAWNEGGIPADPADVACVVDMDPESFTGHWEKLAAAWVKHPTKAGLLVNERQEKLREEKERVRAKRRKAGQAGAEAKWQEERQTARQTG